MSHHWHIGFVPPLRCLGLSLLLLGCASDGAPEEPAAAASEDVVSAGPAPDVPARPPAEDARVQPVEVADPTPPPPVAVQPPQAWVGDPQLNPFSLHMTWQRDPARTITFHWATLATEPSDYAPRAWVVPKSVVDESGGAMPMHADFVTEGEGIVYQTTIGGVPIDENVYVIWIVEVVGLEPNTEYVYRVGDWADFDAETGVLTEPNLSAAHGFRTGVPKGSRERFEFVMAGDSRGGTVEIEANMDTLSGAPARMWFFNGDMTDAGTQDEWEKWWGSMAPITTKTVLMPVQGNHELFADLYYTQVALPRVGPELPVELEEHAWTVDFGNVHFVGLDSNTPAAAESQVAWLDADLGAARSDPDIDWIFVMSHHPAYSSSTVHGSTSWVQKHWVPIFEEHQVDIAFAGHDHTYERSKPVREDQAVGPGEGVVYIVAGGFFSPAYANGSDWWTEVSVHGDVRNWLTVVVEGKTVELTAWPGDGGPTRAGSQPIDTLTLTKP